MSNADSDYSGSREKLPVGSDNSPELAENINEFYQIHENVKVDLEGFYSPR